MSFFTKNVDPELLEEELTGWQRSVSILLYITLFAHGFEVFLINAGVLEGIIPALQVIAAVSGIAFFVLESLILPPVGLAIMAVVATLLSLAIPYFVAFMVRSLMESLLFMIVGGMIAALSAITVIVMVNGVVIGVVLVPLVVTPFLVGAGAVGVTAVTGAAVGAAVDAGVRQVRPGQLVKPRRVLVNLLALLLVVWPLLTWTGVFQGVFALKPVQRAQQQYLSFSEDNMSRTYQLFFEPREGYSYTLNGQQNWTFGEGFYTDYIYPGRNTFAQGAAPAAANDTCIAFCLNGMVYLTNTAANEVYHTTAYSQGKNDAIVLVGQEAFIFSHDRIALLGPSGRYLWKDTRWASDFDRLSESEQYDRLYAILEAQNDGVAGAVSVEDVAAVACAQRSGLLLYYDGETHSAFFAKEGRKGSITVLCQTAPGVRQERGSFTPNCKGDNLPYTMLNGKVLAYIDGEDIIFMGVADEEWSSTHYTNKLHDGKVHPFVSFHVLHDTAGNEYFAYQDSEDVICLELLGSPVMEAKFDAGRYDAVYSVGDYIYGIVYDSDNILNAFTYVNDVQEGESSTGVWTERWGWDRIKLHPGLWGQEEKEEQPPEEKSFDRQYPVPELRTSVRQIGLYKDNVVSPSQYVSYRGPADKFFFRVPPILYEEVEYEYSEDGANVRVHFYCEDDPSTLTVTLRPNEKGTDHQSLLATLQKQVEQQMTNVRRIRNGPDKEGTASIYYATGNAADDAGLLCTRLLRVDGEHIMEMELRIPRPVSNEDKAYKEYYMQAMYLTCGFGPGGESPVWWKFKTKYGL